MDFFDLPTHLPNASGPVNEDGPEETGTRIESHKPLELPSNEGYSANEPLKTEESSQPPKDEDIDEELLTIQGTNIKLETEEDIQKWIEERKKNWPSKQNIERKKEEPPAKKAKNICKFYQKNKSCKYGAKCKNVHEDSFVPNRFEYKNDQSLFKMLVKNDQLHENNQFIEFLRYIDKRGVLKDV